MKSKLSIISAVFVICVAIVMLVYAVAFSDQEPIRNIKFGAKALVIIVVYFSALAGLKKGNVSKRHSIKDYEIQYKDIIGDAFQNDKKSYSKLMDAIYFFNADKCKKAVSILEKLENCCITTADFIAVLMFKALSFEDMNLPNAAAETYEELLRHDVTYSRAWSNLSITYSRTDRNEEALSALKNAVAYDPDNAYAYSNLATFCVRSGEYEIALENALKALKLNSNLAPAMSAAAIAYSNLDDYENAEKYCGMYGAHGGDAEHLHTLLKNKQ